ncbi:MAG: tRNA uridine-5-carboxymethylaminomethyl(34) synthesis enzyme MnmG, partial [Pseudooceanicola nanhaiensis]
AIPADFDFEAVDGLSNEIRAKLGRARPGNLAQASKIEGVTPAALTLLLARIRKDTRRKSA